MKLRKAKGFTLIELLVVIAIIGILSTLAVVALNSARAKARDAKRVADVKQVQTALELYYNDVQDYPGTPAVNGNLGEGDNKVLCTGADAKGFVATATACDDVDSPTVYMNQVPADPQSTATVPEHYIYAYVDNTHYTITFTLEGSVGDLDADEHTASESGIQ